MNDTEYLARGSFDADLIRAQIRRYLPSREPIAIMDFGCSTGRVLRHFHPDHITRGWQLYGVDVQALCIEWLRRHFPPEFIIYTGTTLPTLPFADNSLDVIYGHSTRRSVILAKPRAAGCIRLAGHGTEQGLRGAERYVGWGR